MGASSSPTPRPLTSSFLPLSTKIRLPFLFSWLSPNSSQGLHVTSLVAYLPSPPSLTQLIISETHLHLFCFILSKGYFGEGVILLALFPFTSSF